MKSKKNQDNHKPELKLENSEKETLKEKKELLKTKRQYVQTEEELSNLLMEIHQIEKKLYSLNNPKGPL